MPCPSLRSVPPVRPLHIPIVSSQYVYIGPACIFLVSQTEGLLWALHHTGHLSVSDRHSAGTTRSLLLRDHKDQVTMNITTDFIPASPDPEPQPLE